MQRSSFLARWNAIALIFAAIAGGAQPTFADPPTAPVFTEAVAISAPFAWEAELWHNDAPFSGTVQLLLFRLFDAPEGGEQVGPTLLLEDLEVQDGRFAVDLDFGDDVLAEEPRWLEVTIDGEPLLPRTRVVAFPVFIATDRDQRLERPVADENRTGVSQQSTRSIAEVLRVAPEPTASDDAKPGGGSPPSSSPPPPGGSADGTDSTGWRVNGSHLYYNAGHVGIGTANPVQRLHVWSNTGTAAIHATHAVPFGNSDGIRGVTQSLGGRGVFGLATNTIGATAGIMGQATSNQGRGVFGLATSTGGATSGVLGQSNSTAGRGVFALAANNSGTNFGIVARTNSSDGYAGFFLGGRNYFEGNVGIGRPPSAHHPLDVGGVIAVNGHPVIDANRRWVGDLAGLQGPPGPEGPEGPQGPPGPAGGSFSPLTGAWFADVSPNTRPNYQSVVTLHGDGTATETASDPDGGDGGGSRGVWQDHGNGTFTVVLVGLYIENGVHHGNYRVRISGQVSSSNVVNFTYTSKYYQLHRDVLNPNLAPDEQVNGSGTARRIPITLN